MARKHKKELKNLFYKKISITFATPNRGVEQLVARQAHNLEVVGSSPASATRP